MITEKNTRLNTLRALTAIYVVFHHLFRNSGPLGNLFAFGQEAVIIFILLSGRVISMSEHSSRKRASTYYLARIYRIYPPLLLTLTISAAMYKLNLINANYSLQSLLGTLFALQDISSLKPGVITDPFLGNAPLWSLSYEIYFYLLYPFIRYFFANYRRLATFLVPVLSILGIFTYLVMPNHFSLINSYLIIWWIGYFSHGKLNWEKENLFNFCALSIILFILGIYMFFTKASEIGIFPGLLFRHFAFAAILFLILRARSLLRFTQKTLDKLVQFQSLSSISYGLYITHYPILILWRSKNSLEFLIHTLICIGLAFLVESKSLNPFYCILKKK